MVCTLALALCMLPCTFSAFVTLSQLLAHFLILSQLLAHFLNFWLTFSAFGILFHLLSHILNFWHTFSAFFACKVFVWGSYLTVGRSNICPWDLSLLKNPIFSLFQTNLSPIWFGGLSCCYPYPSFSLGRSFFNQFCLKLILKCLMMLPIGSNWKIDTP